MTNYLNNRANKLPETDISLNSNWLIYAKKSVNSRKIDTHLLECCKACTVKIAENGTILCVFNNLAGEGQFRYIVEDFEFCKQQTKPIKALKASMLTSTKTSWEILVCSDVFEQQSVDGCEKFLLKQAVGCSTR